MEEEFVNPLLESGSCTSSCLRDPSTSLRFAQDDIT
jgi:hypothetical protein